ncbi:TIGR01621 family pseudouridine synthase [Psychromonas sp. MB-3u-54]|uniref:TIGR01621 family pseudouridine synthase n=1 Tax=Psychromonas sp. MB-3u-54 TaxID=2058319 RepID=UPI000C34DC12|nr:TIGR01621 family pseudouridine synthase [Psychromonas sp. MB-3u-54]PKH03162.1 TIGR01621 family pseudouridine synthase [Psychromonas sp. MB-3u-54]
MMNSANEVLFNYKNYFSVVSENNEFIVINKQAGINFHSEDGEFGVVVAAEKAFSCKLYSVHRLDKMTSGLLLLAKSSSSAAQLSALFFEHQIQKYYLAISDKKPKKKQGLIKGGMEKSRRSMWKLTKQPNNLAITQFFSYSLENGKRLFVIKPRTGKTHQIRVALNSIGSAICGDPLYAEKSLQSAAFDRAYLHAYQIDFTLNNQDYHFQASPESGYLFVSEVFINQIETIGAVEKLDWPKI